MGTDHLNDLPQFEDDLIIGVAGLELLDIPFGGVRGTVVRKIPIPCRMLIFRSGFIVVLVECF